jgi:hypothetical protein
MRKAIKDADMRFIQYVNQYTIASSDGEITSREAHELVAKVREYRDDFLDISSLLIVEKAKKAHEEAIAAQPKTIDITPTTK